MWILCCKIWTRNLVSDLPWSITSFQGKLRGFYTIHAKLLGSNLIIKVIAYVRQLLNNYLNREFWSFKGWIKYLSLGRGESFNQSYGTCTESFDCLHWILEVEYALVWSKISCWFILVILLLSYSMQWHVSKSVHSSKLIFQSCNF